MHKMWRRLLTGGLIGAALGTWYVRMRRRAAKINNNNSDNFVMDMTDAAGHAADRMESMATKARVLGKKIGRIKV